MKGKGEYFGTHRVIKPEGLLPQAADKINNTPDIWSNEILIDVIALQPTATAFHTIKEKYGTDINKIKEQIYAIVEERGKFQDPVTKSGGILIGRVKKIGSDLHEKMDLEVGDKIATLVSLSLTPLKIYEITNIDLDTEQIVCNADAVLFESGIFTKIPNDLGQELSLAVMDVAGAPTQIAMNAKPGDIIVVMGAGKAGLLCLAEAKKRVAPHGKVVCLEYSKTQCDIVKDLGIEDVILEVDGQKPLETYYRYMEAMKGQLADFAVNTVNVKDTELSTILVTKDTGKIYFFSMSTDFAILNGITSFLLEYSTIFSTYMAYENIPKQIYLLLVSFTDNKFIMLLLINIALLVIGCFLDTVPAIIIMAPILLPAVVGYGVNPVHFGIIMTINLAIGLCTPPYGCNLFVGAAVAKIKMESMFKYLIPFFIVVIGALMVVTYIPILSLMFLR